MIKNRNPGLLEGEPGAGAELVMTSAIHSLAQPTIGNIPWELQDPPQWVVWRNELVNGRPTKVPYDAGTGRKASTTDESNWTTFDRACAVFQTDTEFHGIGFVFSDADEFVGVDLDNCRNLETSTLESWAQKIVDELDSYAEISVSGTGVHIILYGRLPGPRRRSGQIEIYDAERYFTVTGWQLEDTPKTINDRQNALSRLYEQTFPQPVQAEPQPSMNGPASSVSDTVLLDMAMSATNGEKFRQLWSGDLSLYDDDHSRADAALCSLIAFWTGPDRTRIERLFEQSKLADREKWQRRPDYRERTIKTVLEGRTDFYSWDDGVTFTFSSVSEKDDGRPASYNASDLGNAERFVSQNDEKVRYSHSDSGWFLWTGTHWRYDDSEHIGDYARETVRSIYQEASDAANKSRRKKLAKHAIQSESSRAIRSMLELARSFREVAVTRDVFDQDLKLVNFQNGTLDLRTGEVYKHRPGDLITRVIPYDFNPDVDSALFDRFLADITGEEEETGELRTFLRRAAGSGLAGWSGDECLFYLHGPTQTGKSTFIEAVRSAMGDYAAPVNFESLIRSSLNRPRPDLVNIVGARVVFSNELDRSSGKKDLVLAVALVKRLTSNEPIFIRSLHSNGFNWTPNCLLWLASNDDPVIDAGDDAAWRRILRIPFTRQHEQTDKTIRDRLIGEVEHQQAVMAWLVRGYVEYQRHGMVVPESVREYTDKYRAEMDPLTDFFATGCVFGDDKRVKASELNTAYERWCELERITPASAKERGASLRRHGCVDKTARWEGKSIRTWHGIERIEGGM